jgi:methylenetetrahydrofolate dehydrogenase (NADP+)/methenyltetrahydrofolate cyclohydrolase
VSAKVIDGKAVAAAVRERVAAAIRDEGLTPGLATILVGDDPASAVYVRMKREDCAQVGIESFHHEPGGEVSREDLAALIADLNADSRVHGILLQLPLPDHLDDAELTALIDPGKDVDGLTPANAGLLMHGREALVACTPTGVMELLDHAGVELSGARAVVVGRSQLVGKPLAQLLLAANATVTHCHSRTRDLADECRRADVIVAAAGRRDLITYDMVGDGAVVIDVGTNRTEEGKLTGDVDYDAVSQVAGAITPVPGGVGPMTRAMLLENTLKAARRAG